MFSSLCSSQSVSSMLCFMIFSCEVYVSQLSLVKVDLCKHYAIDVWVAVDSYLHKLGLCIHFETAVGASSALH